MVITNQGVAIQLGFSSKITCSFENRPIGCVYKTGTKYASKDDTELAVFKAELLLTVLVSRALARGTALRTPARGTSHQSPRRSPPRSLRWLRARTAQRQTNTNIK